MQHPAPSPEADRDGAEPHPRRRGARLGSSTDALRIAAEVGYESLGTFEFLVDADRPVTTPYVFLEANPRLAGRAHGDRGGARHRSSCGRSWSWPAAPRSASSASTRRPCPSPRHRHPGAGQHGDDERPTVSPARPAGVLTAFEVPSGAGYRTDSFGYVGYRTSTSFDSLLAKVIVHTPSGRLADAVAKASRALAEFRIEGVADQRRLPAEHPRSPGSGGRAGDDPLRRRPPARARRRGPTDQERLYFATDTATGTGPRLGRREARRAPIRWPCSTTARRPSSRPGRRAAARAGSPAPSTAPPAPPPSLRRCRARSCRSPWPRAIPCAPASSCSSWKP